MTLSQEQEAAVRGWVEQGAGLAEVQRRLAEEFQLKLTFLDTRFLVDDLKLTIQSPDQPTPAETPAETPADDAPESTSSLLDASGKAPETKRGGVSVSVDQLAIPGTLVSGKVTFSDGQSGRWYLDELGRLGFDGADPSYRPSEADLNAFQAELQKLMRSQGF